MGRTRTPCPSCGKVDWRRKVNHICPACEYDRQELARIRKERSEAQDGLIPVKYGMYSHWNATIHAHEYQSAETFGKPGLAEQLTIQFQKIADLLAVPTDSAPQDALALFGAARYYKHGYMRQDVAEALAAAYDLLQPLVDSVRKQARKEGFDLLGGLARGEITVRDFERNEGYGD